MPTGHLVGRKPRRHSPWRVHSSLGPLQWTAWHGRGGLGGWLSCEREAGCRYYVALVGVSDNTHAHTHTHSLVLSVCLSVCLSLSLSLARARVLSLSRTRTHRYYVALLAVDVNGKDSFVGLVGQDDAVLPALDRCVCVCVCVCVCARARAHVRVYL